MGCSDKVSQDRLSGQFFELEIDAIRLRREPTVAQVDFLPFCILNHVLFVIQRALFVQVFLVNMA